MRMNRASSKFIISLFLVMSMYLNYEVNTTVIESCVKGYKHLQLKESRLLDLNKTIKNCSLVDIPARQVVLYF